MSCPSCSSKVHPSPDGLVEADGNSGEFPSASTNPCKLCTPLGACLAFKGIAGAVPLLHGSQGCATYIRRYLISHFREPVDIASTNFSEDSAVFGGRKNLHTALDNIGRQYRPALVGIATTCLSETMGENIPMLLHEYCGLRNADCGVAEPWAEGPDAAPAGPAKIPGNTANVVAFDRSRPGVRNPHSAVRNNEGPALVHVSTPSFKGTHAEGFHAAVRALVETLAGTSAHSKSGNPKSARASRRIAVMPGMVSPADLRHLRDFCAAWGAEITLVPDYAETLDGPSWADFVRLPEGGTTVDELRALNRAVAAIEFGRSLAAAPATAGTHLNARFGMPLHRLGLPIGLRGTDAFCEALNSALKAEGGRLKAETDDSLSAFRVQPSACGSDLSLPARIAGERGRLVDSYVDAHKYLAGKKAVVYGEDDLVAGLAVFLAETGITPVLVASGERNRRLADAIFAAAPELRGRTEVREGSDFGEIETRIAELKPDLLIGSSKGYKLARSLGVPLVRCGFPVHDRLGAQRIRLLGYAGTQELFDRIVNALLEAKQEDSEIGYSYL